MALNGQINAIAKWYHFNDIGNCPEIDDIAKRLKGSNYEELWAMGHFVQRQDYIDQTLDKKVEEYKHLVFLNNNIENKTFETERELLEYVFSLDSQIEEKEKDIKEGTYLKYYRAACKTAQSKAKEASSSISSLCHIATACEMFKGYAKELPSVYNLEKNKIKIEVHAHKLFNTILRDFKLTHKKLKSNGFGPSNYPQFYFTFANLITSNKDLLKLLDKKLVYLAEEIYQEIAKEKINVELTKPDHHKDKSMEM